MGPRGAFDSSRYSAQLKRIDRRQREMVDLVRRWSRINSGSGNLDGLARMGEEIVAAFDRLSPEREIRQLPPATFVDDAGEPRSLELGPVYRFSKRLTAERRILLTGHIDTVFSADHPFQEPKLLDDNRLNGPGVADMKGGLIVMLNALMALEESDAATGVGWEVLISSDEEIGSIGSAAVLAERAPLADIGLTYEPALADGTLAGARKGSGNFTFVVRGRAAHAGREFEHGRNAVAALGEVICALDALNGKRDGVTVNVAKVSGGTASNIVPDTAVLRINARIPRAEDARWLEAELAAQRDAIAGRDGFSAEIHGGFNRPPKPLFPRNERLFDVVVRCGKALGITVAYRDTGGCCEGNNLAAAGLPNVDTLGVRGGAIHSADEFVLLDSFAERAKLSALIMLGFAEGRFEELRRD